MVNSRLTFFATRQKRVWLTSAPFDQIHRVKRPVVDEKAADMTDSPRQQPSSSTASSATSSKHLNKEQLIAARILGYRNRKMSVAQRADVLDYLNMRNSRYRDPSRRSLGPGGASPRASGAAQPNTTGPAVASEALEDANVGPEFRGSYFLPDEDKHMCI